MADGLELVLRNAGPIPLDCALRVSRGATLALLGPSGSGKTSVLRAIAGLLIPDAGRITCNNQVWLDDASGVCVPPRERRVGFVFQSYGLFPHLSAQFNVMEAMLDRPLPERRKLAQGLLEQVQLDGLAHRRPLELSGGQQQRVALARALAREPEVLLLDEPFSAVDHPTRRALHALLAQLRQTSDVPMILVSHDVRDVAQAADEICLLLGGKAVEHGKCAQLLADPASAVAHWLACS